MPPDDPAAFRVDVSREAPTARLRLAGELDTATTPILQAQIAALRESGSPSLVLDLTGLEFIDSTGLRCILDLDAESRQDGFSIALIQGPLPVRRIFELTNTDTLLRFIEP
jgi:anti-sigma B factor antagonist